MKIITQQAYLECSEGTSNKFYHVVVVTNQEAKRATIIKRYGPIGKFGSLSAKHGLTATEASVELSKVIREKERKGYVAKKASVPIASVYKMGVDNLKDKEFLKSFEELISTHEVEVMRVQNSWSDSDLSKYSSAPTKKAPSVDTKSIEKEREEAYSSSWGAW